MAIQLIAVDIDGTLLDSRGHVPEANRAALHEAAAAGIDIVLVTGRSFHHAQPIARQLAVPLALIVSNGALVKRTNGRTLHQRLLRRDAARAILTAARTRWTGAIAIFDRTDARQYRYEHIDWSNPNRQGYYQKNRAFMSVATPLEGTLTEDPVQVAFNGGVNDMRQLVAYLRTLPVAANTSMTLTEYVDRNFSLLDITAAGCSKGSTLQMWSKRRGITPEGIMAVGDNLNDRDMLAFVGHPVVMANAVPELKAAGWPITGSHDAAGLADAIRDVALQSNTRDAR